MFLIRQVSHLTSVQLSMPLNWMKTSREAHPQIKAESWHFNLIVSVSFQIQCVGVQSQNNVSDVSGKTKAEHWQCIIASPPLYLFACEDKVDSRVYMHMW